MALARITTLLFFLYLTLGQRYTVGVATGGRGVVSPLEPLFIGFAVLLWFRMKWRPLEPVARGVWLPTIGPLFSLLVALPIVAVIVGDYDFRSLYSLIVVVIPLSILTLGRAARRYSIDMRGIAFAAILVHGLYGFAQLLYRLGLIHGGLSDWAARWDAQSQTAFSVNYVISTRSTGLFVDANTFGMWSVLAIVFGAVHLRRSPRIVSVVLGVLGVVGSQSRTAWVALVLLAVGYLLTAVVVPRLGERAIMTILMTAPAVAILALLGVFRHLVEANSVTRLLSGLGVLSQGAQADPNLAGRFVGWDGVSAMASQYVFGTLGPPQIKFESSIDSQFMSYYLQGGVILVLAYVLALLAPLVLWHRGVPRAWALAVMTGMLAVFSFTMAPVDSSIASALVWVSVALSFGALGEMDRIRRNSLVPNGAHSLDEYP